MNIKLTKLIGITIKMLENDVEVEHYVCDDSTGEVLFEVNDNNEIVLTRNLLDKIDEEFEEECDHGRQVSYEVGKQIGYKDGYSNGYKEGYDSGHKDALDTVFPTDDITITVDSSIKNFD